MKRSFVVGVVLVFIVSVTSQAEPPTLEAFVAAMNKGEVPSEFPILKDCEVNGLAAATVQFAKTHPEQLSALLDVISRGFRPQRCKAVDFAAEVRRQAGVSPEILDLREHLQTLARGRIGAQTPAKPSTTIVQQQPVTLAEGQSARIAEATLAAIEQRARVPITLLALLCVAIMTLLTLQLVAQTRARADALNRLEAATKNLDGVFMNMKTVLDDQQTENQRAETLRTNLEGLTSAWFTRLPVRLLSTEDVARVAESLDGMRQELSLVGRRIAQPPPPPPNVDAVDLEREALRESWQQFQERKDLTSALENAARDGLWQKVSSLLFELPKHVPDDLKPTLEAVLAPARDHHNLVAKISLVPRVVKDELPRLETPREVRRTRELASLLDGIQNSSQAADRLNFRVRTWITDTFLGFADLYLQRFQQAQLESRGESLQKGASIVRDVLHAAEVEPIDIRLGQTTFDSTRHVGRSTANDPRFGDGVIVGVIRNGFMEGGQLVMRQPEVIVNRTR